MLTRALSQLFRVEPTFTADAAADPAVLMHSGMAEFIICFPGEIKLNSPGSSTRDDHYLSAGADVHLGVPQLTADGRARRKRGQRETPASQRIQAKSPSSHLAAPLRGFSGEPEEIERSIVSANAV